MGVNCPEKQQLDSKYANATAKLKGVEVDSSLSFLSTVEFWIPLSNKKGLFNFAVNTIFAWS